MDAAEQQLQHAESLIRQFQLSARYAGMIQSHRVMWWLATNQFARAQAWAREFEIQAGSAIDYAREGELLALARVYCARQEYVRALEILHRLAETANSSGRQGDSLPLDVLRACIYAAQGDHTNALTLVHALVTETAGEKYTRMFVSEGEPMRALLLSVRAQWKHEPVRPEIRAHLDRILAAFPQTAPDAPSPVSVHHHALIEPLTPREVQMLQLVAQGFSDREISVRLSISPATVKKHLANLFGKLDVHSRTQAIARARETGLL